jgi:hypothetical protein
MSGMFWLAVCLLLLSGTLYFIYLYPYQTIGPQQPIFFSHRVHAGDKGIDCRFCHSFVERSTNPGMPPLGTCFFCHRHIITGHPQIVKLKNYFDAGNPVPWIRLMYLPDYTRFNHQAHVENEVACADCHGGVTRMDRIYPVTYQMGFCISCHRARNAQLDCWLSCHY